MRAAGLYPAFSRGPQRGTRLPENASYGKPGHVVDRLDGVHFIDDEPEPVPKIDKRSADGRAGISFEDEPRGVALAFGL